MLYAAESRVRVVLETPAMLLRTDVCNCGFENDLGQEEQKGSLGLQMLPHVQLEAVSLGRLALTCAQVHGAEGVSVNSVCTSTCVESSGLVERRLDAVLAGRDARWQCIIGRLVRGKVTHQ